jgi:CxxC motif-containing protein (DUF1111 family)
MSLRIVIVAVAMLDIALRAAAQTEEGAVDDVTGTLVTAEAYRQILPAADRKLVKQFEEGRIASERRWSVPFEPGLLWGRGPVSNGEGCSDCHPKNGRGRPPGNPDEPMRSMLVRLSIPGDDGHGGPKPHPDYGGQLNYQGVERRVPGEGEAHVIWTERRIVFADGESVVLRAPRVEFRRLAFGPLGGEVMTSTRIAPALIGLGLLEAVPEELILSLAQRERPHGIGGKPNYVWDNAAQRTVLGRFGLKANQPNLTQQTLTAFHQDLGVTSAMYPDENCMPVQTACREQPSGGRPELNPDHLNALVFYLRAAAAPARRDLHDSDVTEGERLFIDAACAACHVPELRTGIYQAVPAASNSIIHPYTDLLLHDMGEALGDGRPDYRAGGREWRTAPLWGLGLLKIVGKQTALLHDGRARDVIEAILWHGGEAEWSRDAFLQMTRAQRDLLVKFLYSL